MASPWVVARCIAAVLGCSIPAHGLHTAKANQTLLGGSAAAAGSLTGGPNDNGYKLKFIDTAKHPLAVCNDGSPGAYYVREGDCPKHTFVIHQQGGWWCWDDYSCKVRSDYFEDPPEFEKRHMMSSKTLAERTTRDNLFNGKYNTALMATNPEADPHFFRATKVFIAYCSSDSFAGNRTVETQDGSGRVWHFRGKEIVRAVISELVEQHRLGESAVTVLAGGSAGGIGTIANGDWVATLIPPLKGDESRKFIAYPDAGVFMDVVPNRMCDHPEAYECKSAAGSGHGVVAIATQMQKLIVYSGGRPDDSCAERLGRWGAWRCYLGQYAWPHLGETFLLNQMQTDVFDASYVGFTDWKTKPEELEYALWFRAEVQSMFKDIASAADIKPNLYAFVPNCVVHTFTNEPSWWTVQVDGRTSRDVIGALAMGKDVHPHVIMDNCKGIHCSQGCAPEIALPFGEEQRKRWRSSRAPPQLESA